MSYRFNNGNGATTCDACGTMITSGKRVIVEDSITVPISGTDSAHLCTVKCLTSKIDSVETAIANHDGRNDDYWFGSNNLALLIAEHDKQKAITDKPAQSDALTSEAITLSRDEVHVLWAAMQAMVDDNHAPQDTLTKEQWDLALRLLASVDTVVNTGAG